MARLENNIQNTYVAGENIGVYRPVMLDTDGQLYLADHTNLAHISKVIGVSVDSGLTGAFITVLEFGFNTNVSLNSYSPGPVFVGVNVLTQVKPSTGFVKKIGDVPKAGEIHVNPAQSVCLN